MSGIHEETGQVGLLTLLHLLLLALELWGDISGAGVVKDAMTVGYAEMGWLRGGFATWCPDDLIQKLVRGPHVGDPLGVDVSVRDFGSHDKGHVLILFGEGSTKVRTGRKQQEVPWEGEGRKAKKTRCNDVFTYKKQPWRRREGPSPCAGLI